MTAPTHSGGEGRLCRGSGVITQDSLQEEKGGGELSKQQENVWQLSVVGGWPRVCNPFTDQSQTL